MHFSVGSIVSYREREWVVLPSEDSDLILLRPIGKTDREVCGVYKPLTDLIAYSLPFERIKQAEFPLPSAEDVKDHQAVRLLLESARLLLREGAAPFRCLGHLSIRPRPYQFVPLLMSLRLETVRLLIADDVGVGKTIEAALIARELLDRGEIRRLCVLCPPYLCEQWQKELSEKFHIDAVVIRSGTVARLERETPPDKSIFSHYTHFVASIDFIKSERYRASFLEHCPEFAIIDEVHGAAESPGGRFSAQQKRHALVKEIAKDPERHLILLTATPHSGHDESFLSILGLLKPEFCHLNLSSLSEEERTELARCFIQRRRADVKHWLGEDTPFPERDSQEVPYEFSSAYKDFFESVYEFAHSLVRSARALTGFKKRMRFFSALALLRCIASSPAAAKTALLKRTQNISQEEIPLYAEASIYDSSELEGLEDTPPVFEVEEDKTYLRRLRSFASQAQRLKGKEDKKLQKVIEIATTLLKEGFHPIIWCRYIATADYVAEEFTKALKLLFSDLHIISVTGALSEDERRLKVKELSRFQKRVLVATDCLSEGINLQEHFTAIIHYDLPWNPNRLEQREGRVDRFGQRAKKIKTILLFGRDNPVDGAVLDVLLRKAKKIHKQLGIYVPVPQDSKSIMEAVFNSLFSRKEKRFIQLTLFGDPVEAFHQKWDIYAQREKESRTRFAQRAIKPEEVKKELDETDAVLGSPESVKQFLQTASQRLGFSLHKRKKDIFEIIPQELPEEVKIRLGNLPSPWRITFLSPTPEDATYIGRNHPLIETLAEYLFDAAFNNQKDIPVSRCGVIRTDEVTTRTTLLLLRLRYRLYERKDDTPNLAEETCVFGFKGIMPKIEILSPEEAYILLDTVKPIANVPLSEKQEVLKETLSAIRYSLHADFFKKFVWQRAQDLSSSHKRIRRLLKKRQIKVEPYFPPDLLGVLVILPVPKGVSQNGLYLHSH